MKNKLLLLGAAFCLTLTSCGGGGNNENSSQATSDQATISQNEGNSSGGQSSQSSSGQNSQPSGSQNSSIPEEGSSAANPDESASTPEGEKIDVDLNANPKSYAAPNLTDAQFRMLMTSIVGEENVDSVIENMKEEFDLQDMLNHMGFSFADLSVIFGFIGSIARPSRDAGISFEAYIETVVSGLEGVLNVFDGDKLAINGVEEIKFPIGGSGYSYNEWGISPYDTKLLDDLTKAASGTEKAQLEALKDVLTMYGRTAYATVSSSDLIAVGRLVKAVLQSALQTDRNFVKFLITRMFSTYSSAFRDEDDMAYRESLWAEYDVQKIIQTSGLILKKLNISGPSYSKLLFSYAKLGVATAKSSTSYNNIFDTSYYEALSSIIEELEDVVSGNDLKVLFEFLFDGASQYTAEMHEKLINGKDNGQSIIQLYDSLYAKLSAAQKKSLSNLASVAGLDYQEMIESLKTIPETLNRETSVSNLLKEVFQPVIDKYNTNNRFDSIGIYSSSTIHYLALNEAISAKEVASWIDTFGNTVIHNASFKEAFDTTKVGEHVGYLNITVSYHGQEYQRTIGVRYYVLPDVLAENGPFFQTNPIALKKPTQYVITNTTREFGVRYSYGKFNRQRHRVESASDVLGYTYGNIAWTTGKHIEKLENRTFVYYVYDDSMIESAVSYIKNADGVPVIYQDSEIVFYGKPNIDSLTVQIRRVARLEEGKSAYINEESCTIPINMNMAEGASSEFTFPDGSKGTIYRAKSNEIEISDNLHVYTKSVSNSQGTYIIPVGSAFSDCFYAYSDQNIRITRGNNYLYTGRTIHVEPTITGFNTASASNVVATAKATFGSSSSEISYITVNESMLKEIYVASSPVFVGGSLANSYYSCRYGYDAVKNGENVFLTINERMVSPSAFGNLLDNLDVQTAGKHVEKIRLNDKEVTVEYNVITVEDITVRPAGSDYRFVETGVQNERKFIRINTYFEAVWNDERIERWELPENALRQASLDWTPGVHEFTATASIGNQTLSYNVSYTVFEAQGNEIRATGMEYVRADEDSINVAVDTYVVLNGKKEYISNSWLTAELPDSSHGYHKETLTEIEGMPVTGEIEYYVYDDSDIQTSYGEAFVYDYFTFDDNNYRIYIHREVVSYVQRSPSDPSYVVDSRTETVEYVIPENDRTVGVHQATIRFENGDVRTVSYGVYDETSRYVDVRVSSITFSTGTNIVSLEQAANFYVDHIYVDREIYRGGNESYSTWGYVGANEFRCIMDTSKATDGFATGYIIYAGQAFEFEYMIFDPASVADIHTEFVNDNRSYFFEGELQEGEYMNVHGMAYTRGRLNGLEVTLDSRYIDKSIQLTKNDVTVGKHSIQVEEDIVFEYEIYSLNDSRISPMEMQISEYTQGYKVGESIEGEVYIGCSLSAENEPWRTLSGYVDISAFEISGFDTSVSSHGEWKTATVTFKNYSETFRYFVYDESDCQQYTEQNSDVYLLKGEGTKSVSIDYYVRLGLVYDPDGNEYASGYSTYGSFNVDIDVSQTGLYEGSKEVSAMLEGQLVSFTIPYSVWILDPSECIEEADIYEYYGSFIQGESYQLQIDGGFYVNYYYLTEEDQLAYVGRSDYLTPEQPIVINIDTSSYGECVGTFSYNGHEYSFRYNVERFEFTYFAADGQRRGTIENGATLTVASGGFIDIKAEAAYWLDSFTFKVDGIEQDNYNNSIRISPTSADSGKTYQVEIICDNFTNRSISFSVVVEGELTEPFIFELASDPDSYWAYTEYGFVATAVDNGVATLNVMFFTDGEFYFEYFMESEQNCDRFCIYLCYGNGKEELLEQNSGYYEGDFSYYVKAGYTLKLTYEKDGSVSNGSDSVTITFYDFN